MGQDANGLRRVGDLAWVVHQSRWHTTSALIIDGRDAVVTGPGFDARMISAACERAGLDAPATIHLLVTHMDFDHLRGIGRLPEARVLASTATAAALADDQTRRRYATLAEESGAPWEGEPRIDELFVPGDRLDCGSLSVETLPAPGHTPDSVAFVVRDARLMLPGDYLSLVTYPLVTGGLVDAIVTHEALLAAVEQPDVRVVIPGHGPVMDPKAAAAVGGRDLEYLVALREASVGAAERGLSGARAAAAVRDAVQPPRAASGGFEALNMHAANAGRACGELG